MADNSLSRLASAAGAARHLHNQVDHEPSHPHSVGPSGNQSPPKRPASSGQAWQQRGGSSARSGSGIGRAIKPRSGRGKRAEGGGLWGGSTHPLGGVKGALTVTVKTGSTEAAGTDARIWMRLHGKENAASSVFELVRKDRHCFANGQLFKFDLVEPDYPDVNLRASVADLKGDEETLGGDIKRIQVWRDDGRDVSLDGEDPSWWLDRIKIEEPYTGDCWDFTWDHWVDDTMDEPTKALLMDEQVNVRGSEKHKEAMNKISACPGGAQISDEGRYPVIKYDTMHYKRAGGYAIVGGRWETELQWGWTESGRQHFVSISTLDKVISGLIVFTLALDIWREEFLKACIVDHLKIEANSTLSEIPDPADLCDRGIADALYPVTLGVDLVILLIFLVELIVRYTLKYWGIRNMFAYVLKNYNRRYGKLGLEAFKKNGIRRNDSTRSKTPWFRTLWVPENAQFRKEFDDARNGDIHTQRRIPFNFLARETIWMIVFELSVVVLAIVVQCVFLAVSGWTISLDMASAGLGKFVSVMRILRVSRIVTRIGKLKALTGALAEAFSGVIWIFILMLVVTYGFAIIALMVFVPKESDVEACLAGLACSLKESDDCDAECIFGIMQDRWGNIRTSFSTLFFNVVLGDGISDVIGDTKLASDINVVYLFVILYLIMCTFLLMEAITGYIVDIISGAAYDRQQLDDRPFAAVARVRVVEWFESLQEHPSSKSGSSKSNYRSGEQDWLGPWLSDATRSGKIDIRSVAHVRRMLKKVQAYDLQFAQMEYETDPGGKDFQPSDWLIGVRSEAEMSRLEGDGFVYWDKEEDAAPKNEYVQDLDEDGADGPESLHIPVVREPQGSLIQISGLRTPTFALEDHVREAFQEYGLVMKVEREDWDLPEDES